MIDRKRWLELVMVLLVVSLVVGHLRSSGQSEATGDTTATYAQARQALDCGHFEESAELYGQVLEVNPQHGPSLNDRAWCYFKLGRHEEGLADMERCFAVYPPNIYTLHTRASLLAALGRDKEALVDVEAALLIGPNYGPALELQKQISKS